MYVVLLYSTSLVSKKEINSSLGLVNKFYLWFFMFSFTAARSQATKFWPLPEAPVVILKIQFVCYNVLLFTESRYY